MRHIQLLKVRLTTMGSTPSQTVSTLPEQRVKLTLTSSRKRIVGTPNGVEEAVDEPTVCSDRDIYIGLKLIVKVDPTWQATHR